MRNCFSLLFVWLERESQQKPQLTLATLHTSFPPYLSPLPFPTTPLHCVWCNIKNPRQICSHIFFFAQCLLAVCDFTLFLFFICFLLFCSFSYFLLFSLRIFSMVAFRAGIFYSLKFGFLFSLSSTAFVSIILGAAKTLQRVCAQVNK